MISIIICGAGGRMGQAIIEACRECTDIAITGLIESQGHSIVGRKISDILPEVSDDLGKIIDKCDAVIDFTSPEASVSNARIAARHQKAMVIGTTGISEDQMKGFKDISKQIPLLVSSNMSIGVNLLYGFIARAAKEIPGNFDVEIIETHHKNKKDADRKSVV